MIRCDTCDDWAVIADGFAAYCATHNPWRERQIPSELGRLVLSAPGRVRRSLRLEFDRDYGGDKRVGWSVSIDGVCVVQFADTPLKALHEAFRVRASAEVQP